MVLIMDEHAIEYGRRFKEERLRLGLTQADVHRATGIARHTIVSYEAGTSTGYFRHRDIFEELGFNFQYVFFEFDFKAVIEEMFDTTHQIIIHMLENDRGVDRQASIDILTTVFCTPRVDISEKGHTIKAALSLVPKTNA